MTEADQAILRAGTLYRLVADLDVSARPFTPAQLAGLADPMAVLFFQQGIFPMTAQALLAGLPEPATADDLPVTTVEEAAQLPLFTTLAAHHNGCYAVSRAVLGHEVDLLIGTGTHDDPHAGLLRVAAWDPSAEILNYYAHYAGIGPTWLWVGSSRTSGAPAQGRAGIGSAAVMRELTRPWIRWLSEAAVRIAPDCSLV